MKYILVAVKTKFVAVRILRIKGPAEQPEPTRYSENLSRCSKTRYPDLLEHKTPGYKRGRNSHFEGEKREKTAKNYF